MTVSPRKLQVLPNAECLEEALIATAHANGGFVDGSGFCTFAQFAEKFAGPEHLGRRPCSPLASRAVVWSAARELGPGPFGALVNEPSFARMALRLIFDLKLGRLGPEEFFGAIEGMGERAHYLALLYAAYER